MGYSSVSQVFTNTRTVPIVPVGGKTAVEPTQANISTGAYPFTTFTYVYVNKTPGKPLDPGVQKFLAFALSKEGQKQVQLDGRIPLPEDMVRMSLHRISR
jgi:phosphate transport system substrate-binding protein